MSRLTLRQLKETRSGLRPPPPPSPPPHDHEDVEHCQQCGRHYSWAWWHRKTRGHDPSERRDSIWAEELEDPFGEIEFAPFLSDIRKGQRHGGGRRSPEGEVEE